MTTFREALGRPVIATDSAEQLGEVRGFVVDGSASVIRALHIGGTKRAAEFVSWDAITSFGDDAVMVAGATDRRASGDEREARTASGELALVAKRVLTESGDEVAPVDDVEFDSVSGEIEGFVTASETIASTRYLGIGSYALMVQAEHQPGTPA